MKFPRRMQDMSRDSAGDSMAGTSQVWEPPQGQTSTFTQPVGVPTPPPSVRKEINKKIIINDNKHYKCIIIYTNYKVHLLRQWFKMKKE